MAPVLWRGSSSSFHRLCLCLHLHLLLRMRLRLATAYQFSHQLREAGFAGAQNRRSAQVTQSARVERIRTRDPPSHAALTDLESRVSPTREMHEPGLHVDSEAAKSLKVAPAQSGPKSMRRSSPRDLDGRYRR